MDSVQDQPWPWEKLNALEKKYPDLLAPIAFMHAVVEIDGGERVDLRMSPYMGDKSRMLVSVIESGRLNPYVIDQRFLGLWLAKAAGYRRPNYNQ